MKRSATKRIGQKFNWQQTGMPATLVSRLGQRNEFAEFKTVLNDARDQVMHPVDVETMAHELVESGGREFVEMVRELTTDLANTKKELEDANRRYERLVADLKRRRIRIGDTPACRKKAKAVPSTFISDREVIESSPALQEWEEWDRKFQSLLR